MSAVFSGPEARHVTGRATFEPDLAPVVHAGLDDWRKLALALHARFLTGALQLCHGILRRPDHTDVTRVR